MPSPILHGAAGYSIYRLYLRYEPDTEEGEEPRALTATLFAAIIFSVLPDIDSLVGIIRGNFGRYHNNLTHSFFAGLAAALPFGLLMQRKQRSSFKYWFSLASFAYMLHVVMDSFTWGRGVMALWPLKSDRFRVPLRLFYGFHWSDGWWSRRHLWTFLTELMLIGGGVLVIYNLLRRIN
jgi:membrane-bound metal-dependent hydrolase YbcI (DUF457 family)